MSELEDVVNQFNEKTRKDHINEKVLIDQQNVDLVSAGKLLGIQEDNKFNVNPQFCIICKPADSDIEENKISK